MIQIKIQIRFMKHCLFVVIQTVMEDNKNNIFINILYYIGHYIVTWHCILLYTV